MQALRRRRQLDGPNIERARAWLGEAHAILLQHE
jgi:hypothetical protein